MKFQSFDHVYEENQALMTSTKLLMQLIEAAQQDDIVYTVPGHPRVAETTTVKLEAYAQQHDNIQVEILGGKSFIDEAVKVDPNDGFTCLMLRHLLVSNCTHTLITQVYSPMTAEI